MTSPTNCVIIDDEHNAVDVIKIYLEEYDLNMEIASFSNALEGYQFLKMEKVDLVFLDVQMPGISGIDLLRKLNLKCPIVLTTAYRHYAPEAYDLEVFDYLLKPISKERFNRTMQKYVDYTKEGSAFSLPTITFRINRADHHLEEGSIFYFESYGDYVKIHLKDQVLLTKEPLKSIECRVSKLVFRRIHRGFIVNSARIQSQSNTVVQINNVELPKSRRFIKS